MSGEHIVVGVSNSPAADAALRWALDKAERTDSVVTAVHVFDASEHADHAMEPDQAAAETETHRRAERRVRSLASECGSAAPLVFRAIHGGVGTALPRAALTGSALVVGKPQRQRHQALLELLVERSACPVVAVSADGEAAVVGLPTR